MSTVIDIDKIFQFFIILTSNQIKKSFKSEEQESILSSFTKRFSELFEKLKEKHNETQIFQGINPIFVISLEEALPTNEKSKKKVTEHVLAIYRMMLEDMVLEPQRRFMSSSKNPWATFVEDIRKGNKRTYENEYFRLQEVTATEEEFAFDINRCFYQEIFKEFDREDLGSIMCEYDSIVAENVAKWVRFECEQTIADGFPKCKFRYYSIKQKFSDNPFFDNIYSFLKIIDDSDEMLTKQEIIEKGIKQETDFEDLIKLIETIKNHPGIKTSLVEEELLIGNVSSYKRYEEWKLIFNRKIPTEERSKYIRNLPLKLKDKDIDQLITRIIDHPYELDSIKWLCLQYLQHHFSSEVGFDSEGIEEVHLNYLLEEFTKNFSGVSFKSHPIRQEFDTGTRVSIHVYGKGVTEYKLKEFAQLLRKKLFLEFSDASLSVIKPVLSIDRVTRKFFDILEDPKRSFQLRELALRILISKVGIKLVPFLITITENKEDDQFLRGRAIDTLSEFISKLPQLFNTKNKPLEEFENLPIPVQRSIIDFVTRHGIEEDLLVSIAKDENITVIIRKIALRNLGIFTNPTVTDYLLDSAKNRSNDEILRQASLEAVGRHDEKSRINKTVFEIFINPEESTFIRMEAFETLKDLNYIATEDSSIDKTDWITTLGLKQLLEE